jgi:hypothetical protein
VRVTKLPETFRATPRLGATVVPFPAQLDARFCEDVRSSARNAGNALFPPDSRRLARELVRTPTDQDVDLPFATTLVDGTLRGAAETAARAAGVSSPRFEPLPPIRVTRLEAIYEGDAQTKLLGALEEIQEDLDEALAFGAAASASGSLRLSTNAADLLCDLWTRRAQIVVHYTVGAAPARTLLTGLDPRTGP